MLLPSSATAPQVGARVGYRVRNIFQLVMAPPLYVLLQHLWASGSSQTLDYIACKFIPAASKECQQKKSIILQKYGIDTSYLREW